MSENDDFWGMVVYDIHENGCLNGLWTNNSNEGVVRNEIAVKTPKGDGIDGNYNVTWIEIDGEVSEKVELEIKKENGVYKLEWKGEFKGKGFLINKKLVITYWKHDVELKFEKVKN